MMKKHSLLVILCIGTFLPCSLAQNVGVGITTPISKLHIKGSANTSQLIIDAHSTQSNTSPLFKLRNSLGSDLMWIHSDDTSNTFVGLRAGKFNNAGAAGLYNTFIGSDAGYANTTGAFNTANGNHALYANTTGAYNTANGFAALFSNTIGANNTANGFFSLGTNTSGNNNTTNGYQALYSNTTGSNNIANGFESLYSNTTGSNNTAYGSGALWSNTSGNNNTAIGHGSSAADVISNATAIGSHAYAGTSNSVVIGSISGINGATASASVGIGTTTPHNKAILQIQSTSQGVLFPTMTMAQRDAILNPPHGLHIFNSEDACLNYYDANFQLWNCYCDPCKVRVVRIQEDTCSIDFYNNFAVIAPAEKYLIVIDSGVTVSACDTNESAIHFLNMPSDYEIQIINYGTIAGGGGTGGSGTLEPGCVPITFPAFPGKSGGNAILTKPGVVIHLENHGIVSGGGGGGGGSGENPTGYGGGGGGGAGIIGGNGGIGGGTHAFSGGPFSVCVPQVGLGGPGMPGQSTIGGAGGIGVDGGAMGGNGGNRGQAGMNGSGHLGSIGGAGGKAIAGGSGNVLVNLGGGQSFGVVD